MPLYMYLCLQNYWIEFIEVWCFGDLQQMFGEFNFNLHDCNITSALSEAYI